ncbi:MAG: SAM-dependent methyltransferase [Myxococcota bacterium]
MDSGSERRLPISSPDAMLSPMPDPLDEITRRTLSHYTTHAEDFRIGTWDHDVSQNVDALLSAITANAPCRILDVGCGPGRDLVTFSRLGHHPTGLDGTARFCQMARAASGCPVYHQDLLKLTLPPAHFHGIFANACLFHVPAVALPDVLRNLWQTLQPGGILFSSNPRGDNQAGWGGDRYGHYHDLPGWTGFMEDAGFSAVGHYYRPPGRPRSQQPWLASTWQKP